MLTVNVPGCFATTMTKITDCGEFLRKEHDRVL